MSLAAAVAVNVVAAPSGAAEAQVRLGQQYSREQEASRKVCSPADTECRPFVRHQTYGSRGLHISGRFPDAVDLPRRGPLGEASIWSATASPVPLASYSQAVSSKHTSSTELTAASAQGLQSVLQAHSRQLFTSRLLKLLSQHTILLITGTSGTTLKLDASVQLLIVVVTMQLFCISRTTQSQASLAN